MRLIKNFENFGRDASYAKRIAAETSKRRRRIVRYGVGGAGGIAAGALLYRHRRSSGTQGITPQASGSGGYPTGMYGM